MIKEQKEAKKESKDTTAASPRSGSSIYTASEATAPDIRVSFCVLISRDFARLLQMESLLAGYTTVWATYSGPINWKWNYNLTISSLLPV